MCVVVGASWSPWETVTVEGVLQTPSVRQRHGAHQDRTGVAQSE